MAALAAASRGQRVLILERASLPRDKTCAGGLVGASMRALPAGFDPPVRATATAVTVSVPGRPPRTRTADVPLVRLVRRRELDSGLVERAVAAGAELDDGAHVTGLADAGDAVRIAVRNRGEVRARVVVGADGSAGRTAAHVGVTWDQVDLGLEVELVTPGGPAGPDSAAGWDSRIVLDWGHVPGGYAWVFPKGETLSAGVIAARGLAGPARAYLAAFLARLGLSRQETLASSGHLTRCRTPDAPLVRGRVLVAGDAAGLLDPWTREGISFALRSGTLAGAAAAAAAAAGSAAELSAAMAGYERAVAATLAPAMEGGRLFLRAFTRHPLACYRAVARSRLAWTFVERSITGDADFGAVTRWPGARPLLRALGAGAP